MEESVYGKIDVGEDATVNFTQSNVYIEELKTKTGVSINFSGCTNLYINKHFKLEKNTVTINAKPDVNSIVVDLEWLINNPEHIEIISKNARRFIEKEHELLTITRKYLEVWEK